jgi:dephospho-CoA kinase
MLKVGVTGGIGSGKSTVCRIFECLGVPIFRADDEGRKALAENNEVKKQVIALLGESVIDTGGKLNRTKIASLVFNNPGKLKQLNAIIHPKVREAFAEWLTKQNAPWVIEEAAIIFESGLHKTLDSVIVVSAPDNIRIKRVMERDRISKEQVRARMKNQVTEGERVKRADFVITNDGTKMLIPQALEIYKMLSAR